MYDLNKILTEAGNSLSNSAGQIVGGEIANRTTDAQKGFKSSMPEWLTNIFGGVVEGFSSTPGGSAAISETANAVLAEKIKGFFSTPLGWVSIGLAVLLGVAVLKGKK